MELILANAQNASACPMFVLYKLLLQRTHFLFQFLSVTFVLREKAGLSPWHGVRRDLLCRVCPQVGSKGHTLHVGLGTEGAQQLCGTALTACYLQCPEQSEMHLPGVGSSLAALLMSLRANTTHHLLQIQTEFITLGQF